MCNALTALCRPLQMSAAQKAVLMCRADFAHADGRDWHSFAAVMNWTCLGKTAVIEAHKYLESRGFISIDRRLGARHMVHLQIDGLQAEFDALKVGDNEAACDIEPVRLPDRSVKHTGAFGGGNRSVSRTTTGAPGGQTGAPGAPKALEASVSIREASGSGEQHKLLPGSQARAGADRPQASPTKARKSAKPKHEPITASTWTVYAEAYRNRYGVEPVRGARENGQLARLVKALGEADAVRLVTFYLEHPRSLYAMSMHPLDLLVRDMQALRTQMLTGCRPADPLNKQEAPKAGTRAVDAKWLSQFDSKDYSEGVTNGSFG